jgi:seryl-tRNA synthetase
VLDIKLLRQNRNEIEAKLKTKDPSIDVSPVLALDEQIRQRKTALEKLLADRNRLSKEIGEKKRRGEDAAGLMQEVESHAQETARLNGEVTALEAEFHDALSRLPNIPRDGIKVSLDPKDNVCIRTHLEKPHFSFPFKNHVELNEKLDLFDFKRGAKISGSGWPVYKNLGARLEWALINYMLDTQLENGFTFCLLPNLVRQEVMFGSGQLPKFESQLFKIRDDDYHLYLIPTSEIALNGLHRDEILTLDELPIKYASYSPCFRREAGAAGSQERGLIRMHQFNKVEMFAFTTPDESDAMFEAMTASAEQVLKGLGLHYRTMELVTGDMSYGAAKTFDIEVWLPGQNRYYEVSSVSNCTDFQARRSQIRFRNKEGKTEFVHTLNGSGLATSRLMVALLENNQREDGSVAIPLILHKYLGGLKELNVPHTD